jgi:hypothetical protein
MQFNDEDLPRIKRKFHLGHITLLNRSIEIWLEEPGQPLNGPVLYEYAATCRGSLTGIYFGMARQGIGRPLEQYGPVLQALRENRGVHKFGDSSTPWRYKKNDAWGFRWVHHQLERLLLMDDVAIALSVKVVAPPTKVTQTPELGLNPGDAGEVNSDDVLDGNASLSDAEKRMIGAWKSRACCWNEKTMRSVHQGRKSGGPLDPEWV